ncbi:unnamed protein product [Closterium sp. NIES-54]
MVIEGWLEPERIVVASASSGPESTKPARPAAEPHPPTVATPHAPAPAGPAPVAPVALVAPVGSPVPLVIVDALPGAPILDAPLASVALPAPIAAVGSSPHAVSATTGGPGPGEVGEAAALLGPVLPPAATSVPPPEVQAVPDSAPLAAAPLAQHQPSPGRRQHQPHSPAPRDEPETTRRRHDSPRRCGSHVNWAASRGGRGGWWRGCGRGGGWAYDQPVTMADLQRVVSDAMRQQRNGQASQSNSLPVASAHASPPSASAAAHGNRMRLPWVPPVVGMEFVTVAGGPVTAQYPSLLPVAPAPLAATLPVQSLVGPTPSTVVPEASLGQLWRLSEGLRAVHLIQVYGHAALSQGVPLDGGPRDECLDAADRLAELLAPVLAAPARGGVAGIGQLGTAVHGLR